MFFFWTALCCVVLPFWLSGNTLVSINVVTLRYARLVPGWVTVFGQVHHLGTEPGTGSTQLSHRSAGKLIE